MSRKVYLLWANSDLLGAFSSWAAAKQKQQEIENKIAALKEQFEKEKLLNIEDHYKKCEDNDAYYFSDEYDDVETELILFAAKHKEINYRHFKIEEKEVE
jgi:poly-D-alanine transfer protein DltD